MFKAYELKTQGKEINVYLQISFNEAEHKHVKAGEKTALSTAN